MSFTKILLVFTLLLLTKSLGAQQLSVYSGFTTKFYEEETQISREQFKSLLAKDNTANQLWNKSNKHIVLAFVALAAELGFAYWTTSNSKNNDSVVVPLVGMIGSAGAVVCFALSSDKKKKESIRTYNKNVGISSINLGTTYNGIGLVLKF